MWLCHGHDAARLHLELAQAELAPLDRGGLVGQVGAGAHDVGDAHRRGGAHLLALAVGHPLVGRAFAGEGGAGGNAERDDGGSQREAATKGRDSGELYRGMTFIMMIS